MVDSLLGPKRPGKDSPLKRRRAGNRLARSILLGAVAVVVSIYAVGRSFQFNWSDIEDYVITSMAFVALLIAAAMVCAAIFWLLRRITRGKRQVREEQ